MVKRISSLIENYQKGIFGKKDKIGVILSEVQDLVLYQVAAWPETLNSVGTKLAKAYNLKEYPSANKALKGSKVAILRIEPLKWWIVGGEIKELSFDEGNILDLSHSRTHIRIVGNDSISFSN